MDCGCVEEGWWGVCCRGRGFSFWGVSREIRDDGNGREGKVAREMSEEGKGKEGERREVLRDSGNVHHFVH